MLIGWLVVLLPTETITSLGPVFRFPSGRALPEGGSPEVLQMPAPKRKQIPENYIRDFLEFISYDPATGIFRWAKPRQKIKVGNEAGCDDRNGYREIRFRELKMHVHRFAWMIVHGPIPDELQVDHINGIRNDNRIANLRLVTHMGNCENKHQAMSNFKSGLLGVSWCKQYKAWVAVIKYDGKKHVIGRFDDPHEAHAAYIAERRIRFPHNTL